ncbi:CDP-alcohol phosphatidyltransferase family protein [Phenylobacterium sp.]|uniref:CDP-alcohol phosphatidyltransferase family protein n=1 Tax=Phenylobacterium sp. TaxID=1871053 RepID=UPI002E32463A|nr:CDP-alcohol phosphatidyltransferase family protein [Phenylobacterium sp.]
MRTVSEVPPFTDFVSRRFAVPGPFWSWMIFERIGGGLAYCFARLGVPPAAATLLGGAAGVSGAILLGVASTPIHLVGALTLLLLSYALDCSDGQLARATRRESARGAWMDVAVDSVVIAFVTASLTYALLDGNRSAISLMLGGAFGASRTASLFTSTIIRRDKGGMQLSGLMSHLRTAFIAAIDTPFVYAALCATRLTPPLLETVILGVTVLTAVQTLVSARRHFASRLQPN